MNIKPFCKDYNNMINHYEKIGLKDTFYISNKSHEFTFGVLKDGKPTETLLTRKSDYGKNECLDYIFSDLEPI